jgi:ABC-type phosphate/phosphonate transport system ATPase subunit
VFELQHNNIEGKRTLVQRAIKELNLKPFKLRKSQKLTTTNKQRRVECARRLLKKFGARKTNSK